MKTNQLFHAECKTRYLALLVLLIFTCGNAWGAAATLPVDYSFGSGKSSLPTGVTQSGLGSDYAAVNAPYRLKFDSQGDYIQIEVDAAADAVSFGIKNFGTPGSNGPKFKVQGSANGSSFTDIQQFTVTVTQNKTQSFTTSNSIDASYRYFRIYKSQHTCNVGLGTLQITKAAATCSTKPTVGSSLSSVSATANSITATVPISAIGGCNITENGLVYSTSNSTPTVGGTNCTKVTTTACGSTAANKTVEITGLTCGTTYYVRGYATNDAGTSYTNVKTQATSDCPLYTITYNAGSGTCATSSWTQPSYGASTTLPEATPTATCDGWSFAGWCTSSAGDEEDNTTSPGTILTGSYTPTSNVTLHAVYTKSGGGGGGSPHYAKVTSTGDISSDGRYLIVYEGDLTHDAVALKGSLINMDVVRDTIQVTITSSEIPADARTTANEFTIDKTNLYVKSASNKYINKSSWANGFDQSDAATAVHSISIDGSNNLVIEGTGTDNTDYVTFKYNYNSDQLRFRFYKSGQQAIALYKYVPGSDTYYMTGYTCCDNIVAAPTVSATNIHYNQFTLSWTNVTGADSYNVTCTGGTPGAIQSDGTTRTCTITGLASANTSYSWTVVATYSGSYCGATPAAGSTTTAQVYAVTYNANGGTVSPLPSTVSYEAGVTVTVAAEPGSTSKSGCTFTGWNTQADGQGTHYDADGTKTFTMPSAAVTLYAEWTKKKNYYVDRMHGTNDGHTVTIDDVVYNCYLREGAYTVPTISDNTSGASACHSEHDHLLFWVTASSVNDDGTLKNSYTEVTPGSSKTATTDGTVYYAIWGKLAD